MTPTELKTLCKENGGQAAFGRKIGKSARWMNELCSGRRKISACMEKLIMLARGGRVMTKLSELEDAKASYSGCMADLDMLIEEIACCFQSNSWQKLAIYMHNNYQEQWVKHLTTSPLPDKLT